MWKDIKEYEGLYQVSNLGRVRSVDRVVNYRIKGTTRVYPGRIRTLVVYGCGYCYVTLSKNNRTKSVRVHRLVAEAFLPNPDNLPYINHKDENKTNNFVYINDDGSVDESKSNLEWCDAQYNRIYSIKN